MREPVEFTVNGVTCTVSPRTPRTDITLRRVILKLAPHLDAFCDEYDAEADDMDYAIYQYAMACSRASFNCDDLTLARGRDDANTVKAHFEAWMNTTRMRLVIGIRDAIQEQDAPADDVRAPHPPDDAKKK